MNSMKSKKLVAMALTAAMFLSAGTGVFAGKSTVKKRGDSISARTNHSKLCYAHRKIGI